MNYTQSERTMKNHTVRQAIDTASKIYKGSICLDEVGDMSYDTFITLPEMNDLVEMIILDSSYWDMWK